MTGAALLMLLLAVSTSAFAQGCSSQLTEKFLTGWSHDMPTLMSTLADDITYEDTTVHAVMHGKDEVKKFAEGFFAAVPDIRFEVVPPQPIYSGNRAAVVWRVIGTQKGDLPGMPASNKTTDLVGVSMMQCADGKITRDADYWDMATMMRQLGYLPTSEAK
jgi:steroid delta-isomerase-like uncharacterized protein